MSNSLRLSVIDALTWAILLLWWPTLVVLLVLGTILLLALLTCRGVMVVLGAALAALVVRPLRGLGRFLDRA